MKGAKPIFHTFIVKVKRFLKVFVREDSLVIQPALTPNFYQTNKGVVMEIILLMLGYIIFFMFILFVSIGIALRVMIWLEERGKI